MISNPNFWISISYICVANLNVNIFGRSIERTIIIEKDCFKYGWNNDQTYVIFIQ